MSVSAVTKYFEMTIIIYIYLKIKRRERIYCEMMICCEPVVK